MPRKQTNRKEYKSVRVPAPSHDLVERFARSNRISLADAYDVIVATFSKLSTSEQESAIRKSVTT